MKPPGKLQGENCGPKRKRKVATKGADLEKCYEVVDVDAHVAQQYPAPFWLKDLELKDTNKDQLLNGEWLTNKHISAISKLLQQQHPQQNGLQDSVVLASELHWESNITNFVQIINICEQHWVCATNIGCPEDVVNVYDSSLAHSTGSTTLKKQCAVVLQTKSSSFTLRFIEVQRQSGGSDCALFAIPNTYT